MSDTPLKLAIAVAAGVLCALSASAGAAEVVIGQVAPFTGPLAPTGTHMRAGAQIYFDHVNASGGVNGAQLRLVSQDDAYKSDQTVKLARELIAAHKPVALFGVVGTGNIEALVKENVLSESGVPLVAMRSGARSLTSPGNPFLFHTRASYGEEITRIVEHLVQTGSTQLAVFYQDDPFGKDGLASAEAAIKKSRATLVASGAYEKNTTKVEAAVKTIAAAQPQAVIMVSNTAASAAFVKLAREQGVGAQLFAMSVTDGPQVVKTIGKQAAHGLAIGQVVPDPNSRLMRVSRELQEHFRQHAQSGIELNHTLLEGYLGARVLVEGLRRAGPNPTAAKLRAALESLRNLDVGDLAISFTPENHSGSKYVDITILDRDGKLIR